MQKHWLMPENGHLTRTKFPKTARNLKRSFRNVRRNVPRNFRDKFLHRGPWPSNPCFFRFAFLFSDFPCFLGVLFLSFPRILEVPRGEEPLLFSGVSLVFFQKSKGWRVRGFGTFGTRIEGRILGNEFWTPEFWTLSAWVEFFDPVFPAKEALEKFTLQKFPSRNSPPKVHLPKFNPEIGSKIHIAPLQGRLADEIRPEIFHACWQVKKFSPNISPEFSFTSDISVRLRFGGGTVRAVPVFGSGGSSAKRAFRVSVEFNRKGRFRFRFRFLENGSGGSGSAFGFREKRFRAVPAVPVFRFRFGSWATLHFKVHLNFTQKFHNTLLQAWRPQVNVIPDKQDASMWKVFPKQ